MTRPLTSLIGVLIGLGNSNRPISTICPQLKSDCFKCSICSSVACTQHKDRQAPARSGANAGLTLLPPPRARGCLYPGAGFPNNQIKTGSPAPRVISATKLGVGLLRAVRFQGFRYLACLSFSLSPHLTVPSNCKYPRPRAKRNRTLGSWPWVCDPWQGSQRPAGRGLLVLLEISWPAVGAASAANGSTPADVK